MTCRDAVSLLGEYLELTLAPKDLARLTLHLAGCRPCRVYLRTYGETSQLLRESATTVQMPEEAKRRLRVFLVEMLSKDSR